MARDIASAVDALEYEAADLPADLVADGGQASQSVTIVTGTGTITGTTEGSGATERTYTVAEGDVLNIQFRTITAFSTVSKVRVAWGAF